MASKDLKQREREMSKAIDDARKARRQATDIKKLTPAGKPKVALRHYIKRLTAAIGEKVKNRKALRKRIRQHDKGSPIHQGIDVSMNNGSIDWQKVKDAGYDFVITKLTEGSGYTDPTWSADRLKAQIAAGFAVAGYHFARPDTGGSESDARAEAQDFVLAAKRAGVTKFISPQDFAAGKAGFALFCDFEHAPFTAAWLAAFRDQVEKLTGVECGSYGYGSSLNPVLKALGSFVWFAAYVSDWKPYFNGSDSLVKIWQKSSTTPVSGAGTCDLNVYLG